MHHANLYVSTEISPTPGEIGPVGPSSPPQAVSTTATADNVAADTKLRRETVLPRSAQPEHFVVPGVTNHLGMDRDTTGHAPVASQEGVTGSRSVLYRNPHAMVSLRRRTCARL